MKARRRPAQSHVLAGKLKNAKWVALGKCSADAALWDIKDLMARGVLVRLEGGARDICWSNRAVAQVHQPQEAIKIVVALCCFYPSERLFAIHASVIRIGNR